MFASVSLNKVTFLSLQQRSWIQTYSCKCRQHLYLFCILVECNPNKHGQGMKDVGSPKSTTFTSTFQIGSKCCFFPASIIASTYTDKNSLSSRCTNKHSQFGNLFPTVLSIGFSQIAFPIIVLLKVDRTDFAQEERLDLPYWTTI